MADEMLLASQRVVPEVLQKNGYQFAQKDLAAALAAILKK
jgi:NAD dependent epimerase/dehydratase family enzyme